MYSARIIKDSVCNGNRVTTAVIVFPEIVHKQILKHRMLSINTRSHRALPTEKVRSAANFIPEIWTKKGKGMVASDVLDEVKSKLASSVWEAANKFSIKCTEILEGLGVHKEKANRLLEPFSWCTMIVTGTRFFGEYSLKGFFELRCAPDVQDETRKISCMLKEEYEKSVPVELKPGEWHLPFVEEEFDDSETPLKLTLSDKIKLSCARAARVSYLNHEGKRDLERDYELYERLVEDEHMSALEHCAEAMGDDRYYANLKGWKHWRYKLEKEI